MCSSDLAYGGLGNGAGITADQASPSPVDLSTLSDPNDRFVALTPGNAFVCGLTAQGAAYCWGTDFSGNLGNGAGITADQAGPSPVDTTSLAAGERFVSLTAGGLHVCGITSTSRVFCWGSDGNGDLGNGAGITADQAGPSLVDLSALSAGDHLIAVHASLDYSVTCGLSAQGKAYCWGPDWNGQLGNGAGTVDQALPGLVTFP